MSVQYYGAWSMTISCAAGIFNTWTDWHLIPSERPVVASPKPTLNIITVPGSNARIDLTELQGMVPYENRTGTWEFYVDHDQWRSFGDAYRTIAKALNGQHVRVVLSGDGGIYDGRVSNVEWSNNDDYSTIQIEYELWPIAATFDGGLGVVENGITTNSNVVQYFDIIKGKNFCPNYTTRTVDGVTLSVNQYGYITVTRTSTQSADVSVTCGRFELPSGDFIINGCPSSGGATSCDMYVWDYTESVRPNGNYDYGNGAFFSAIAGHSYTVTLRIRKNYQFDTLVFAPMIRRATDKNSGHDIYSSATSPITAMDILVYQPGLFAKIPTNRGDLFVQLNPHMPVRIPIPDDIQKGSMVSDTLEWGITNYRGGSNISDVRYRATYYISTGQGV